MSANLSARVLLVAGILLLLAGVVGALVALEERIDLNPGDMAAGEGARYVYTLPQPRFPLVLPSDTPGNPFGSSLRLNEDGNALGPAHALAYRIAREGGGRYLHTGSSLYFSASDGSDPRSNSRQYVARQVLLIHPGLQRALRWGGAFLIAAWALRRIRPLFSPGRVGYRALTAMRPYFLQIAITLAIFVMLAEVWARIFPPTEGYHAPSRNDPELGSTFKPNARIHYSNGLDFSVAARANALGFADRPAPPKGRAVQRCRVAFVGDSFVAALEVPIRQKVQVVLEELAGTRWPDVKLETMAFGFPGTGQINQLSYYDHAARVRKPDVVVLVAVSNDFPNNSALLQGVRYRWHPEHTPRLFAREQADGAMTLQPIDPDWRNYRFPKPRPPGSWAHRTLHKASRFYRWLYAHLALRFPALAYALGGDAGARDEIAYNLRYLTMTEPEYGKRWLGIRDQDVHSFDQLLASGQALPPAAGQALRFTEFAFGEFKRRAERDGAHLVVLGAYDIQGPTLARFREILGRVGVPFLSQRDYLLNRGEQLDKAHWPSDIHWSPQGHRWAAQQLADYFAQNGLCGAAS